MAKMPGMMKRVTHLVCHDPSPTDAAIAAVADEVQAFGQLLRDWRARFDLALLAGGDGGVGGDQRGRLRDMRDKRFEMCSTALVLAAAAARCGAAVAVEPGRARALEAEAQAAARATRALQTDAGAGNARVVFYLARKAKVAEAVIRTAGLWAAAAAAAAAGPGRAEGCARTRLLVEGWRFERWCDAIPRSYSKAACCA
jgi:hypothetical protein